MNQYIFFLGQNKKLAQAELEAIFPDHSFEDFRNNLRADLSSDDIDLFCRLGGTLKVAQKVSEIKLEELQKTVPALMNGSKRFSLTFLDDQGHEFQKILENIKEVLSQTVSGARFVIAQDKFGLTPVIIQKQKVVEFFFDNEEGFLYQTVWSHPFRQWVARDRHRPYVAPKLGMLPPKLARIMVNLALKGVFPTKTTLLDPFCGTGTILMEAAMLGCRVVGSDLSKIQVDGSIKNLNWLPEDFFCNPRNESEVFVCDATHLSNNLKQKIDVIVTEPFLGKPNPKKPEIQNILRGLHKLYIGSFKEWLKILPSKGVVVFVYPLFAEDPYSQKQAQNFIDSCENLGYNCLKSDLDFTRPGADVFRKILIFEKK